MNTLSLDIYPLKQKWRGKRPRPWVDQGLSASPEYISFIADFSIYVYGGKMVRMALRKKMPSCVGLLRFGLSRALAGELPAAYPVDHPSPFIMERLACPGV